MASAQGSPISVDICVKCGCGNSLRISDWLNKEHKSLRCPKCDTSIDMSIHFHTFRHGLCKCDELVKAGVAEGTRECNKTCKGGWNA